MYIFMCFLGTFLTILGILIIIKSCRDKKFYESMKKGQNKYYIKTIGTVICDAYHVSEATEVVKAVTPIVEYEVNGEKYETKNEILMTGAELPVGTKVNVWYKKNNPKEAILGMALNNDYSQRLGGVFSIAVGLCILFATLL